MNKFFYLLFLTVTFLPALSVAASQRGVALEVIDGKISEVVTEYEIGKRVVMLFHPNCGYSRLAFSQWTPFVWQKMKDKGLFIVPTGRLLDEDIAAVTTWMEEHPGIQVYLITQESKWPQIKFDLVPSFFVLDYGILIEEIRGWPKGRSNLKDLERVLSSLN